jgi:hypothetical protein
LWCKVQGSIVTVQVKSSQVPRKHGRNTHYVYSTGNPNADWFCFVALDRGLVLLRRPSEVLTKTTRLLQSEFNEANQRRTIEKLMNNC